jgi:hypothetical protein
MKGQPVAAFGYPHPCCGATSEVDLLAAKARLIADHGSSAALALQAVTHRDARWFAFNRQLKLPTTAGGATGGHRSALCGCRYRDCTPELKTMHPASYGLARIQKSTRVAALNLDPIRNSREEKEPVRERGGNLGAIGENHMSELLKWRERLESAHKQMQEAMTELITNKNYSEAERLLHVIDKRMLESDRGYGRDRHQIRFMDMI